MIVKLVLIVGCIICFVAKIENAVVTRSFENVTKCQQKSFGKNKIVCVCDTKQCDTIEPIGEYEEEKFVKYVSNKDGLRMQREIGVLTENGSSKASVKIELLPDVRYQSILGWGAAFTDSAGINILGLSPDVQNKLLRAYFAEDGLEYNFGRVPIGGTDFSTHAYEYNEVPDDIKLTSFNLTMEDNVYKIPLIRRARDIAKTKIDLVAAAWSAPAWMKTSKKLTGLGFLEEQYYQVWADYHLKFFELYNSSGIDFWGVSTGNEPSNGLLPYDNFNAMGWTSTSMSKYIQENFGPTIRKSKFKDLKILALDDQRFYLPWFIDELFANETTKDFVDGVGVHWYWDGMTSTSTLDKTHDNFPNKFLLYTEQSIGDKLWEKNVDIGSWPRGEQYLSRIISNVNHWVTGAIDWNLALSQTGGPNWANNFVDAAILVNKEANEFYKQPIFYGMGHAAKFIPKDSVRIGMSGSLPKNFDLMTLIRPDGRYVIVIINEGNKIQQLSVQVSKKKYANVEVGSHAMITLII